MALTRPLWKQSSSIVCTHKCDKGLSSWQQCKKGRRYKQQANRLHSRSAILHMASRRRRPKNHHPPTTSGRHQLRLPRPLFLHSRPLRLVVGTSSNRLLRSRRQLGRGWGGHVLDDSLGLFLLNASEVGQHVGVLVGDAVLEEHGVDLLLVGPRLLALLNKPLHIVERDLLLHLLHSGVADLECLDEGLLHLRVLDIADELGNLE
mmetsp:Transcript_13723/g.32671  ORF Transcript_13723/g.32671 Transcript_13723/m.32671 type:complete len:205 (-) Transcript_13723:356-970(-)